MYCGYVISPTKPELVTPWCLHVVDDPEVTCLYRSKRLVTTTDS